MEKKLKPFDLEAALNGAAVTTKSGHEVAEVFCYRSFKGKQVIAVINCIPRLFTQDGKYIENDCTGFDLVMKPQQVTKWVNIYSTKSGYLWAGSLFDTKEKALEGLEGSIDTIQITFEA